MTSSKQNGNSNGTLPRLKTLSPDTPSTVSTFMNSSSLTTHSHEKK
jgi:hypothetical protein